MNPFWNDSDKLKDKIMGKIKAIITSAEFIAANMLYMDEFSRIPKYASIATGPCRKGSSCDNRRLILDRVPMEKIVPNAMKAPIIPSSHGK